MMIVIPSQIPHDKAPEHPVFANRSRKPVPDELVRQNHFEGASDGPSAQDVSSEVRGRAYSIPLS